MRKYMTDMITGLNMNNRIDNFFIAWDGTPSFRISGQIRCVNKFLSDYICGVWKPEKTIFQRHVGFDLKLGLAPLCYRALENLFNFCVIFSVWRQ